MNKIIRVILSLDPSGFAAGILTANSAMQLFQTALNALKVGFDELKKVIEGAAEEEKFNFQLGLLMGTTQQATEYFDQLEQHVQGWGVVLDDIKPAVNQLALGLKQVDGAVDPDKLTRYTDIILELSHVTGQSVDDIGTAIRRAITTGDLGVLQRGLGISVENMKGLSEETQRTIAAMGNAQETQLGAVTKVGGGLKPTSDQILKALEEVTQKLGGSKQALEEYGQTWEGQIATLNDLWDQLRDTFGETFIQTLLPELRKFTEYLIEHKEEITAFVEKLAHFTADGLIKMVEALEKLDWDSIAKATGELAKLVGGSSQEKDDAFKKLLPGIAGASPGVQSAISAGTTSGGSFDPGAAAAQDLKKALGLPADWSIMDLFKGGGAVTRQDVHVTVDMDPDGKWKSHVDNAATGAVGQVVSQATQSDGGNHPTSAPHGDR